MRHPYQTTGLDVIGIINKIEVLPFQDMFNQRLDTIDGKHMHELLFQVGNSYYHNSERYEQPYMILYDLLRYDPFSDEINAFMLLFRLTDSDLNLKKRAFSMLNALEVIHRAAGFSVDNSIIQQSYYHLMLFILFRVAVTHRIPLMKPAKINTLDIDLNKCSVREYFDIVFKAAPRLNDNAPFLRNYASNIFSALYYYCEKAVAE